MELDDAVVLLSEPTNYPVPIFATKETRPQSTTEGELIETVFTYRDGNLVMRYKYYWWRDGRYLTHEENIFALAPTVACH